MKSLLLSFLYLTISISGCNQTEQAAEGTIEDTSKTPSSTKEVGSPLKPKAATHTATDKATNDSTHSVDEPVGDASLASSEKATIPASITGMYLACAELASDESQTRYNCAAKDDGNEPIAAELVADYQGKILDQWSGDHIAISVPQNNSNHFEIVINKLRDSNIEKAKEINLAFDLGDGATLPIIVETLSEQQKTIENALEDLLEQFTESNIESHITQSIEEITVETKTTSVTTVCTNGDCQVIDSQELSDETLEELAQQ